MENGVNSEKPKTGRLAVEQVGHGNPEPSPVKGRCVTGKVQRLGGEESDRYAALERPAPRAIQKWRVGDEIVLPRRKRVDKE